ncbi:MAG TPA: DedA family protein [Thermaerobacter sp.]
MDGLTRIVEQWGYVGLVALVALENLFPPIPSEVVLPFAGFMTTYGPLSLPGVVAAATAGSVLGALILYGVGRALGRERVYGFVRRYGRYLSVSEEQVRQAEEWFARYGSWTVFFGRMVPIIRSLISIPAGLTAMEPVVFVTYTVLGTTLWNIALVGAGAALGAAWPLVERWVRYYQNAVIAIVAALVLAFLTQRYVTRSRR